MLQVLVVDHYDSYTQNLVHLVAEVTGVLPTVIQHDDPELREWGRGFEAPARGAYAPQPPGQGVSPVEVRACEPRNQDRGRGGRDLRWTHLVLSPGPGHPAEPKDFALGDSPFRQGIPVLGVCLGMQALVTAYGGSVERIQPAHGEVAQVEHDGSGVFAGIPSPFAAVRYHSLAATEIPEELVVNARAGGVVMGVRHRELPLHGVQFHPESVLSEHGHALMANFLETA